MAKVLKVLQVMFFVFAFLDILGLAIGIISFNSGIHIDQQPEIIQYYIVGSFIGLVVVIPVLFGIALYYVIFDN
jgi:hypothetical protein